MPNTNKIYGMPWQVAFGVPLFLLILFVYLLCGVIAAGNPL